MKFLITFTHFFRSKFFCAAFLLTVSLILTHCSSFDEPSVKKSESKPKASGNIYFNLAGIDSIYFLDADQRQFSSFSIPLPQLWDFDISQDGNWLLVAYGSQIDRYNLLKFRRDYSRVLKYLPRGKITVNQDGRVVIYETEYQAARRLAVLYIETGDNFILSSMNNGVAFAPKIAPSGQEYAWSQYDGLYYRKLNQTNSIRISSRTIQAEDFSQSATYLAAGGDIFDLRALNKYPGIHGGHLRFIDDYFLIQQKPVDCDSLQKINISGTERIFLFRTGQPIIDFEVADGQRFVASVSTAPDAESFLFYVFDFVDLEKEFTMQFHVNPQTKLNKLIWPLRPSSSSKHD